MPITHPSPIARTIAALAAAAALAGPAAPAARAQTQPASAPPAHPVGAVPLTDRPYEIRSLGLEIRLPVGASLDTTNIGGVEASFTVTAKDGTWIMRMHSPTSKDTKLTPAGVADGLFQELRKTRTGRDPKTGRVIDTITEIDRDDTLKINGAPAVRFYARVPRSDGVVFVTGYTIFPRSPGRFIIFQLDCLEPEFAQARTVYETTVATVRLQGREELAADRAGGVLAGDRLLKHFNGADLLAMLPKDPRFFRLYRPGGTGSEGDDTEVAYQVVAMRPGQRGELDPSKPRSRWRPADRDKGIITSVKARFIDGKRLIDSESSFFLAADRASEGWSIRMAVKQGSDTALYTETGARQGDTIEVNVIEPGKPAISKSWKTPPEGYLSQVETYLLPFMLTKVGAELEYAFYTYQPQHNDIMLRRDTLQKSDRPGEWIVLTQPSEDASVDRATLDADGYLVRKTMANGVVMEAIRPKDLARLWRSKGLPTD